MHKQKTYDESQIRELMELLLGEETLPYGKYRQIEDVLTDERYSGEVTEALHDLWETVGKSVREPRQLEATAERTLAAISAKCPDFPAKPPKKIRLYPRIMLRVAAAVIPLLIAGALTWHYKTGTGKATEGTSSGTIATTTGDIEITQPSFPDGRYGDGGERHEGSDIIAAGNTPAHETGYSAPPADNDAGIPAASQIIYAEAGTKDREVRLPDGSVVNLTAGSKLQYNSDFLNSRRVILKGNAFFSVEKMEGKNFEVLYNDVTVTVLGTEFFLNEYGTTVEVTLKSGSVEVSTAEHSVILSPNQQYVIDFGSADFSVIELTEGQMARMIRGRLAFHGTPFNEALRRAAEFFGVEIEISGIDDTQPVRLEFNRYDTLEDVLFILKSISSYPFEYEITGNRINIRAIQIEE